MFGSTLAYEIGDTNDYANGLGGSARELQEFQLMMMMMESRRTKQKNIANDAISEKTATSGIFLKHWSVGSIDSGRYRITCAHRLPVSQY